MIPKYDELVDVEAQEIEFNEKEKEYLDSLVSKIPTIQSIVEQFGSFEEYLTAMSHYNHPRHKEAMAIRELRVKPRKLYWDNEDTNEILLQDLRLQNGNTNN